MKFNLGDKVIYTNDMGEDILATIITVEENGMDVFYMIETSYGIPRIKFKNGRRLRKA